MGVLADFPIKQLRDRYGLMYFVETGTWKGDGILCALSASFQHLVSVEASPTLAIVASDRIQAELPGRSWEIVLGDSAEALPEILSRVSAGPALFWLDAHLPERYAAEGTRLPLEAEVRAIVGHPRDHAGDVILMDDWRLYEAGSYASGNFPSAGGPPGHPAPIRELLGRTHDLQVSLRREGALIAMPRGVM